MASDKIKKASEDIIGIVEDMDRADMFAAVLMALSFLCATFRADLKSIYSVLDEYTKQYIDISNKK